MNKDTFIDKKLIHRRDTTFAYGNLSASTLGQVGRLLHSPTTFPYAWCSGFVDINTVFGLVEFKKGGKCKKENGMENWIFLCLGMGRKQEWKTLEKIFSPGPTNFFLPNREEKQWEKTASVQFYRNAFPPTLHSRPSPTPPKTFAPNPYHFFSSSHLFLQHTVHYSRFYPFFFFSNVITARTPSILEIVESAIIPHNDLSANYLWYKFFFFLRKYLI